MDLPAGFASSPFFMIDENDTVPPNIDPSTIAWIGEFISASLTFVVPTHTLQENFRTMARALASAPCTLKRLGIKNGQP